LHWYILDAARPPEEVLRNAVKLVVRELHRYRQRASQPGPSP
jgi:hypothetical protein